jgi:hypothetical protein
MLCNFRRSTGTRDVAMPRRVSLGAADEKALGVARSKSTKRGVNTDDQVQIADSVRGRRTGASI